MNRPPRVLFLGMQGNFSLPSLQSLIESGIEVCAIVMPAPHDARKDRPALYQHVQPRYARSLVPILNSTLSNNIVQLAQAHAVSIWEVTRMSDPLTLATLSAYQPDIICVACFSLRIPRAILAVPRLGSLNVHPSLLPRNRGPVPLFWTFREGSEETGVTIHMLDEGMDSGDILAQQVIPVAQGISYSALESHCADIGGKLLARTVWELYRGEAVRIAQNEKETSYHSFPEEADYHVPVAEWSAEHVYHFICGVGLWGEPITLVMGDKAIQVRDVISYSHEDMGMREGEAYCQRGAELWIRCKIGWVSVPNIQGVLPLS
jgi:methionyl-tRNA formyltransferase